MNRVIHTLITLALVGCGSAATSTTTTTSAEWRRPVATPPTSAAPDAPASTLQKELPPRPPRLEPAPMNPRVERDLDIASREARERDQSTSDAIVQGIVADANLSPRAKQVDVTTHGGHVTLRGEVPSEQERQEIDAKARFTPGVLDVDDHIKVVP